jgi:dolichol-phosphate mannosyltransferase
MVPTLNEERGIRRVLKDVPKDSDVLVVDGGSTDETVEVARQCQVRVIRQKFGRGKGCGVRTGMEFFLDSKYDVLCMIDGDGSNDPEELPKMIEAMKDEKAEVVLGSRVAILKNFYRCPNRLLGIQQESG